MPGSEFSVLFVCSGNICRSPLAEQILRARTVGAPMAVSSAGTIALDGDAMTAAAAALSLRLGGDPRAHRARLLTRDIVADADLILTATRAHRASVAQLVPRASRRAFTVREFSRVLNGLTGIGLDAPGDPFAVVEAARMRRGLAERPENPEADDVEDPFGKSLVVYERVADLLNAEVEGIAGHLVGGTLR